MKLIFLIICLTIVLLTLESLIVSGFHAKSHRLLPLVLGLVALYDFYLIIELLTGETAVFDILKQLLLIQLLDVILYYILDFINVKLSLLQNGIIISLLIGMDVAIFNQVERPGVYHAHVMAFVVVSVIGILWLVIRNAPKKEMVSKQMRWNNRILIASLFVPAIALLMYIFDLVEGTIFIPLALDVTCVMLGYLFMTDRLREVDSLLKEEHFQTLDIPAFLFDTDFFFLDASKKARELFPVQIAEIEKTPKEFALQKDLDDMKTSNGIAYRKINDVYYRCQLQEARYKGKKKGYILTLMDITEQKNETDFAREAAQQKSDFLASMSHDLRSPLHAIIGSSEIVLSRKDLSSKTKIMVNHIHDAGNNLLDIVNSILDFSKLESGNFQLYPQKYNFKKLVEDQAEVAFANIKDKPVNLIFEITDPYPEYMYGDELRVRQIIQNLISNAIKFTDKGLIKCSFHIAIEKEDRIKIRYSVEDTGAGMTSQQIETVFLDYVTYAQSQKKEGTGLGLSIVRKLSEMMGGRAYAESDGKTGSTVTVEFNQNLVKEDISQLEKDGFILMEPLLIKSEEEIDSNKVWQNEVIPNYTYPNARVLLADDMAVNCEIFKELVLPWHINVETAKNGLEAVELALSNSYDLIILDQMMPVMTGIEAADKLNENGIFVPKILLTANITESMKEQSKEYGFDAFMHKPIDIVQLRTNLEKFLPEELREEYDASADRILPVEVVTGDRYIKSLSIYIKEMKDLYKILPEYMENDLSMFRNKVHGIKGVSRQLGKENIAFVAEIMEMAAITENINFINDNFAMLYDELEYVIREGEQELDKLTIKDEYLLNEGESAVTQNELSENQIKELLTKLKLALEDYDVNEIEKVLNQLDGAMLDNEMKNHINQIKDLYEDLEYEEALMVLNEL